VTSNLLGSCAVAVCCVCWCRVPGAKVVCAVIATPIAIGLAATAVGAAVAVAAVVAPTYGSYKLARLIHKRVNEDKFD